MNWLNQFIYLVANLVSYHSRAFAYQVDGNVLPFNSGDLGMYMGVIIGNASFLLFFHFGISFAKKRRNIILLFLLPHVIYHFLVIEGQKILWGMERINEWPIPAIKEINTFFGLLFGIFIMLYMLPVLMKHHGQQKVIHYHLLAAIISILIIIMGITLFLLSNLTLYPLLMIELITVLGVFILLFDATLLTLDVVLDSLNLTSPAKDTARAFTGLCLLTLGVFSFMVKKILEILPNYLSGMSFNPYLQMAFFQWGSILIIEGLITLSITKIKSKAYISIGRPYMALMGIFPIFIGMALSQNGTVNAIQAVSREIAKVSAIVVGAFLVVMFTNTFNSVHDHHEDTISKPYRPIPSGLMTPREALYLSLIPAILTMGLAFLFFDLKFHLLAIGFLILGWVYSKAKIKSRFLLPYFWMGTGYVVGGIAVGWLFFKDIETLLKSKDFWALSIILGLTAFLAMIMKDLGDMEGDAKVGYHTLPLILGEKIAVMLVSASLYLPILMIWLYFLLFSSFESLLSWSLISIFLLTVATLLSRKLFKIQSMDEKNLSKRTLCYQKQFIRIIIYHLSIFISIIITLAT